MNSNFIDFYKLYYRIKKMGWVKSMRKGYGGIGYTFETLIGKNEESFFLPDFKGIEIKTMRIHSRRNIHLFSAVPDGEFLFPMERLKNILGYPDKEFNMYKVLNKDLVCNYYTRIGYYKIAKLVVDRKNEKIYIDARNHLGKNLNVDVSWSFNLIKERLYYKLKKLVIIEADSKCLKSIDYYYYKKINYYELKSFECFLNLIENGTIKIGIKIGIKKDDKHLGEMKSRGGSFTISERDIQKLYKKVPLEYFEYQLLQ